jgi:Kef-type K+ transport system membrane component KefB
MSNLTTSLDVRLFLSFGLLLIAARISGHLAGRCRQPVVLGELLAGILLGPSVMGQFFPLQEQMLFPSQGPLALVMKSFMTMAVALFLLIAGLEVNLSSVARQGRAAFSISFWGILFPFFLGVFSAAVSPGLWRAPQSNDPLIFALFLGTALSISALPVIARIMRDLNFYRSDFGMLIMSSAVITDLAGWLMFSVILGMMPQAGSPGAGFIQTLFFIFCFVVFLLSFGRWLVNRVLLWSQAHTQGPSEIIGFALGGCLLCSAATEFIGIHSLFGAFLFGVILGESRHLHERTRSTLDGFVSFFFAPLFFASIGLKINLIKDFDLKLAAVAVILATAGKVLGCGWAAFKSGFSRNESLSIGFGMNARGAMEIILGLLALQTHLINDRIFVAIVVMAIVTSAASGSMMQFLMVKADKL